jgi:hypothetical protein
VTYCADHDPGVLAGYLTCNECHGRAYPDDAEWIGGHLLIVAYGHMTGDPDCPDNHRGRLVLLDTTAADTLIPVAPAGNAARAAEHYGRQQGVFCTAWTGCGSLCCFRAKADGLCGVHLAQRARRARENGGL